MTAVQEAAPASLGADDILFPTEATRRRMAVQRAKPRRTPLRALGARARNALPVVGWWLRRSSTAVRTVSLTVGGLGLLSAAGWEIAHPLGLATAGVGLLVLNEMADGGE